MANLATIELTNYLQRIITYPPKSIEKKDLILCLALFPYTLHGNVAAQIHTRILTEYIHKPTIVRIEQRRSVVTKTTHYDLSVVNLRGYKQDYISSIVEGELEKDFGISLVWKTQKHEVSATSQFASNLPNIEASSIEITQITMGDGLVFILENNPLSNPRYSVRIEINNYETTTVESIVALWCIFHESAYVYSKTQYVSVVTAFLRQLNIKVPNTSNGIPYLPSTVFYHARDLVYKDLLEGGILNDIRIGYKTDGFRRALFVHNNAIWLLYANTASLVSLDVKNIFPSGLILDGEYVPLYRHRRPREYSLQNPTPFEYVAYDVLMAKTKQDVRMLTHIERMGYLRSFTKSTIVGKLMLTTKTFYTVSNAIDFYAAISKLEDNISNTPYLTDGYIFISNQLPYTHTTASNNTPRIFGIQHDMAKWKPLHRLTVDLKVGRNTNGLYKVHEDFPFVDLTSLIGNVVEDNIVEFRIEQYLDDAGTIKSRLIPEKIRIDKDKPNTPQEISTILSLHRDPITLSVLLGHSIRLMKKYHNNEKRHLLSKVNELLTESNKAKTLIEFGAGRGSTISSWTSFERIVAIEPDESSILELADRLRTYHHTLSYSTWPNYDSTKKILLVQGVAQDEILVQKVVDTVFGPQKAQVISMFFSMTFFAEESLASLFRNIDYALALGGIFVHATMDGAALKKYLDAYAVIEAKVGNNVLYSIRSTSSTNNSYYPVEIFVGEDGLVGSLQSEPNNAAISNINYQQEYYAYPIRIADAFFSSGILDTRRLGADPMLNTYEKLFSGLCTTGIFSGKSSYTIRSNTSMYENPLSAAEPKVTPIKEESEPSPNGILKGLQILPLALLKRNIAPFARVGYYRHIVVSYTSYSGFYDAILGTFFDNYYIKPSYYVNAMSKYYGRPSIYVLAYELRISIIILNPYNELIDQILIPDRPIILICAALDRVSGAIYYEIISRGDTVGTKTIYRSIFNQTDSLVIAERSVVPLNLEKDPLVIGIPTLRYALRFKTKTNASSLIASSELYDTAITLENAAVYTGVHLSNILSMMGFVDYDDVVYSFLDINTTYAILLANMAEAVTKNIFAIAWGMRRFNDEHLALIASVSRYYHITLIFGVNSTVWLVGELQGNSHDQVQLSKYLSSLGNTRYAVDPGLLLNNKNYTTIIRSILRRAIMIYKH